MLSSHAKKKGKKKITLLLIKQMETNISQSCIKPLADNVTHQLNLHSALISTFLFYNLEPLLI